MPITLDRTSRAGPSLLISLLEDQQDLSAVERFAQRHLDEYREEFGSRYRELLPATPPRPGQQYRFEVDLDACTGCKACVAGCTARNGLDAGESFRTVGVLDGPPGAPSTQTVSSACHHCLEPACLQGCPSRAYEKDPDTGIVRHLDDQCIGCSYCTLTCPYEVPVFNDRLGIVRKCDMCSDRLADGEAPACVQACPTQAISISVVDVEDLRMSTTSEHRLVPTAPMSAATLPTTVFRSARPLDPEVRAADAASPRPAHGHTPIAVMLVLTQLAVGMVWCDLLFGATAGLEPVTSSVALAAGLLAVAASVFHLGRPSRAWRAVLGLGTSWLSREILVFGLFAGSGAAGAAASMYGHPSAGTWRVLAGTTGTAGVACSALIYAVCGREWWRLRWTGPRFAMSAAVSGVATFLAMVQLGSVGIGEVDAATVMRGDGRVLAVALMVVTAGKLAIDESVRFAVHPDLRHTVRLLGGALAEWVRWRRVLTSVGGLVVPAVVLVVAAGTAPETGFAAVLTSAGAVSVVTGELVERSLFFRAVGGPRMPGLGR